MKEIEEAIQVGLELRAADLKDRLRATAEHMFKNRDLKVYDCSHIDCVKEAKAKARADALKEFKETIEKIPITVRLTGKNVFEWNVFERELKAQEKNQ